MAEKVSGYSLIPVFYRATARDGIIYYASSLLTDAGVAHAFSSRVGGVSPPPYHSLNFGSPLDSEAPDTSENISENLRRLQAAIDLDSTTTSLRAVRQVHGKEVIDTDRTAIDATTCGDALVSSVPGILLAIRTADCVPILIATADGKVVAAVHAGWRGIVADVIGATISSVRTRTAVPLVAAIGPCIGHDSFEVGAEVLDTFEARFGRETSLYQRGVSGKGFVDLRAAARLQLLRNGVGSSIDVSDRCTVRDGDEFFSHRRDHGRTGRMIAIIAAKR